MGFKKWFGGRRDEEEPTYQEYSLSTMKVGFLSITISKPGKSRAMGPMITRAM